MLCADPGPLDPKLRLYVSLTRKAKPLLLDQHSLNHLCLACFWRAVRCILWLKCIPVAWNDITSANRTPANGPEPNISELGVPRPHPGSASVFSPLPFHPPGLAVRNPGSRDRLTRTPIPAVARQFVAAGRARIRYLQSAWQSQRLARSRSGLLHCAPACHKRSRYFAIRCHA